MLAPLEDYLKNNNPIISYEVGQARILTFVPISNDITDKKRSIRRMSLSRWLLKGPPETWRAQLEEYNRKEPVFALLGGITKGEWKPVHSFSEDNHIPCLLPITDFPAISEKDWYTLYFSKGFYQEGEAAANYLNSIYDLVKDKPIIQIVRASRIGLALSAGFQETWHGLGHPAPLIITVKDEETLSKEFLQKMFASEKPAALIIWDGPTAFPVLETILSEENRPEIVLVSSGYLGKNIWKLKEQVRDFTYITYPFRLPQDEMRYQGVAPLLQKTEDGSNEQIIVKQSYIITRVLTQILREMNGQYYSDNLLDVIGMSRNSVSYNLFNAIDMSKNPTNMGASREETYPLYVRLSFGPGQRYASKGCYIVQLSKGQNPELVKKSDWVIF